MKAKTHQAMSKRIKITAGGKVMRKHAAVSHLRVNKSKRITSNTVVSGSDMKKIQKMMPNSLS
jgi:large subunit ribosomal protein L35